MSSEGWLILVHSSVKTRNHGQQFTGRNGSHVAYQVHQIGEETGWEKLVQVVQARHAALLGLVGAFSPSGS